MASLSGVSAANGFVAVGAIEAAGATAIGAVAGAEGVEVDVVAAVAEGCGVGAAVVSVDVWGTACFAVAGEVREVETGSAVVEEVVVRGEREGTATVWVEAALSGSLSAKSPTLSCNLRVVNCGDVLACERELLGAGEARVTGETARTLVPWTAVVIAVCCANAVGESKEVVALMAVVREEGAVATGSRSV
jgi:hypothetical protein